MTPERRWLYRYPHLLGEPLGGRWFPPNYESTIDSYVSNVAAASGSTDNVYSVDTSITKWPW